MFSCYKKRGIKKKVRGIRLKIENNKTITYQYKNSF